MVRPLRPVRTTSGLGKRQPVILHLKPDTDITATQCFGLSASDSSVDKSGHEELAEGPSCDKGAQRLYSYLHLPSPTQ